LDFRLSEEQLMIRETAYVEFCDSEMAERSAFDTFLIHCGYGFMDEYAV
jgi:hypothetical protein